MAELTSESDPVSPVLSFIGETDDTTVHAAMAWTVDGRDTSIGYANGVSTPEGGQHITGFRNAVTEAVQRYITDRGLLKDKEQVRRHGTSRRRHDGGVDHDPRPAVRRGTRSRS